MDSTFPVFEPASPQAEAIHGLFLQVLVICGVIFAIVAGLVFVAIVRGRKKASLPEQDFGSERSEIYWMVGPILIVLWLGAITAKLILTINAVPIADPPGASEDYDLLITGHQWWWEIEYAKTGVIGANEVHIPVGKKLRVRLESHDVIHCFWVAQLARKMDVIPGRENYLWLEASEPGVYQGRCAEYCGTQHAWMNFRVYAHTEEDYEKFTQGRLEVPTPPTEALATAGKEVFLAFTCVDCHTIEGTPAQASIGPDLTHIASRHQLGSGILENSPENLREWLKNPQAIKPGCKMPNFKLTERHLDEVVAYLETLK